MIHVGPDGVEHEFPDDASPEAVRAAMQKHYASHTTLGSLPGLSTINRLGKAFTGAGIETVKQTPQALLGLLSHLSPEAPARDARVIAAALQHPVESATRAAQAMAPMPETLKYVLGAIGGDPTGIKPPSLETVAGEAGQLTAQELLGAAPGLLKRGVRAGARHLPGAAVALHEQAIPRVEAVAREGRPPEAAVREAFKAASPVGVPAIWMGNLRRTARKLLQREMRLGPSSRDTAAIATLRGFLDDSHAGWTPQQLKAEIDRMGARIGSVTGVEGLSRVRDKHLKALQRALYKDIDEGLVATERVPGKPADRVWVRGQWVDVPAVRPKYGPTRALLGGTAGPRGPETIEMMPVGRSRRPGVPPGPSPATAATQDWTQSWREAQRLARRAHGFDELESMVNRPGVISVVGDQYKSLNINSVLREIDKQQRLAKQVSGPGVKRAKRFVRSFNPGELEAIRAKFDEIGGDLPRIPVGRGAAHGSGGYILKGIAGEVLSMLIGHGTEQYGWMVGIAVPDLISRAVRTEAGRAAIKYASKLDPKVGPVFQHTLATMLRTQMALDQQPQAAPTPQPVPSPQPQPTRTPSLSDELLNSLLKGGFMPNAHPEAFINAR